MIEPIVSILVSILVGLSLLLGGVVWLIRIEGRVNGHDALFVALEKRFDRVDMAVTCVDERLEHLVGVILQHFNHGAS